MSESVAIDDTSVSVAAWTAREDPDPLELRTDVVHRPGGIALAFETPAGTVELGVCLRYLLVWRRHLTAGEPGTVPVDGEELDLSFDDAGRVTLDLGSVRLVGDRGELLTRVDAVIAAAFGRMARAGVDTRAVARSLDNSAVADGVDVVGLYARIADRVG